MHCAPQLRRCNPTISARLKNFLLLAAVRIILISALLSSVHYVFRFIFEAWLSFQRSPAISVCCTGSPFLIFFSLAQQARFL